MKSVEETAWLIERWNGRAEWWTPIRWTDDSLEATRFAREQDAHELISAFEIDGAKASEHTWVDLRKAEQQLAAIIRANPSPRERELEVALKRAREITPMPLQFRGDTTTYNAGWNHALEEVFATLGFDTESKKESA